MIDGFIPTEPPIGSALWKSAEAVADRLLVPGESDEEIGAKSLYRNLSHVLASAALDLDRASRGAQIDFRNTHHLADVVQELAQQLLLYPDDYPTLKALYQTFEPSGEARQVNEVYGRVMRELKPLEQRLRTAEELPAEDLRKLMNFCLTLHTNAQRQEVPVY